MAGKRKQDGASGSGSTRQGTVTATAHASSVIAGASNAVQSNTRASPIAVGRFLVGSTATSPLVDFAGNSVGPLRARTTLVLDSAAVDRAVATGQGAVLAFENGDPRLPIVTGLVQTEQVATPFQELLVSARPASGTAGSRKATIEARLDGERVVLEGKKEVVLKCGEASITLRSDGKMVLRGAYIETYAKGLNRIKGASVKIN